MPDRRERYDRLYAEEKRILEKIGSPVPYCGFASCLVGTGWIPIIEEALDKMVAVGWDPKVQVLAQIKTKFCMLCIYVDWPGGERQDDHPNHALYLEVRKIIREAEERCAQACEWCGEPHGLTVPRSGAALCPKCREEDDR